MKLSDRIEAFVKLGEEILSLSQSDRKALAEKAQSENPWFIEESVLLALEGVGVLLEKEKLRTWANQYACEPASPKVVGVAMAGNIPLVGFHDFLCVLMSGHNLKTKPSTQDTVLIRFLLKKLLEIDNRFSQRVSIASELKGVNAMIATGSDNTARYFEYYFRNIPNIIRKNRASAAVLLGDESTQELAFLGKDVFSYFGLGCRNVCKLYVPEEFDLEVLTESWKDYRSIIIHHKYANNYNYQKAMMMMGKVSFSDGGFILLTENKNLVSPTAVLFFEKHKNQADVVEKMRGHLDKLQVVVSAKGWFKDSIYFGKAQLPEVHQYSDNIDTMEFLVGLK